MAGLQAVPLGDFARRAMESGTTEDTIVYVPGANSAFDTNIRRAAVLSYDLNWTGSTILIDWPSTVEVASFASDVTDAEWSGDLFAPLLSTVGRIGHGMRAVIAHDVGCRVALRALAGHAEPTDQLILIQPELDRDNLETSLRRLSDRVTRITIYTRSGNIRLAASDSLRESRPFAFERGAMLAVPRVDIVDSPSSFGQSIFDLDVFWFDLRRALDGVKADDRHSLIRVDGGWQLQWPPEPEFRPPNN